MEKYHLLRTLVVNQLHTLRHLIDKAEAFAKEKGLTTEEVFSAALTSDMFSFVKQVRVGTDDARRNLRLLAGKEHIPFEDKETTFAELTDRVDRTIKVIEELKDKDFEGADERKITLFWMKGTFVYGKDFVTEFAINNFLFHVVTAYDILRMKGASIGKMDFITKFSMQSLEEKE